MLSQREQNWNQRYLNSDTPWEDSKPNSILKDVLSNYCRDRSRILEIGCGTGGNAYFLANLGYDVTAIDMSERAIEIASERFTHPNLRFYHADFTKGEINDEFDIAFDRGCFHAFTDQKSYNLFAEYVAKILVKNGYWIDISGNADHPDDLEERKAHNYPRISLANIVLAVEPCFEIQEISSTKYGVDESLSFKAWLGIFQKRSYFYT
ncbi:MAG: class I SAM-dependent methyltransferase [Cyanobacteria bacterium SBLK]|nr:class I SAM-dependent methyltransferase [Cyanobacteria bacterium SBLK]